MANNPLKGFNAGTAKPYAASNAKPYNAQGGGYSGQFKPVTPDMNILRSRMQQTGGAMFPSLGKVQSNVNANWDSNPLTGTTNPYFSTKAKYSPNTSWKGGQGGKPVEPDWYPSIPGKRHSGKRNEYVWEDGTGEVEYDAEGGETGKRIFSGRSGGDDGDADSPWDSHGGRWVKRKPPEVKGNAFDPAKAGNTAHIREGRMRAKAASDFRRAQRQNYQGGFKRQLNPLQAQAKAAWLSKVTKGDKS